MKNKTVVHQMDGLAALLLFAVFAVCVLAVLLTGAGAYRRLTGRDQAAYAQRTCVQYIAARVRQADSYGAVAVEDFGGAPALVLGAGDGYVTRVYCHGGYLMELYSEKETSLGPEDGEQLLEAAGLSLSLQGGLLEAGLTTPDGGQESLVLSLRSGEGAAP